MMSYLLTLCFDCQSIWLILLQCGTKISGKENIGEYLEFYMMSEFSFWLGKEILGIFF